MGRHIEGVFPARSELAGVPGHFFGTAYVDLFRSYACGTPHSESDVD